MQQKTRKIVFGMFVLLNFLMIFIYNYMTPLMSDELLFKADQFHSFKDVVAEQYQNYMNWNARTIPQTIMTLFMLAPKGVFNILNSVCFVLLTLVIYWNVEKQEKYEITTYVLGSIIVWLFSVEFGQTVLWLSGACNYLWPATIILGFLALYRFCLDHEGKYQNKAWFFVLLFLFGLMAGWCNENTSGGAIFLLLCFTIAFYVEHKKIKPWMILANVGMMTGYLFMLLAPANRKRGSLMADEEAHSGLLRYVARFLKINSAAESYVFPLLIFVILLGTYFFIKKRSLWSMRSAIMFSIAGIATCYVLIVIAPPMDRAYFGANLFALIAFLQMISWIPKDEYLLSACKIGGTICLSILLYFSYVENGANLMRILREVQDRDEYVAQQIAQGKRNITVPKIRTLYETKYTFIYKNDVDEDKDSWGSFLYKEYYGVDSIVGVDREDWTEY